MEKNVTKKMLSFLTLVALLAGNLVFANQVSAVVYQVQPVTTTTIQPITTLQAVDLQSYTAVKPVYNPETIFKQEVGSFVVNTSSLINKEVLELKAITSSNAGDVLKTWTVNSSFNKNFVVRPEGTDYEFLVMKLDQKGLNESLEKTNLAKSTYAQYKGVTGGLGTLEIETPKMERLPDRLVLTSKTRIKFKTKAEFDNIKKYYKLDEAVVHQALPTKTKSTIGTGAGKINLQNNGRVSGEGAELASFDSEDILKGLYDDCINDSGCREKLASELGIDESDFLVRTLYKTTKRPYNPKTDDKALERMFISDLGESVIEQVEKIEISLLPVNPLGIKNFNNNLMLKPELVRVSLTDIKATFINIGKIAIIGQAFEEITEDVDPNDEVIKICNQYSGTEKIACLKLAESYIDPEKKVYEKILINGITLGNEYNYSFNSSWSKKFSRWLGSKRITIYSVSVNLSFGYGFGIRIPIKAKIEVDKDSVKIDPTSSEKKIETKISIKTVDANAQQYRDAGVNSTQIFDGKEFVFTVYAYLEGKLVLVNNTVFNKRYDLIFLLGELIGIEGLHSIDESMDFTPPFAGTNRVTLYSEEYGIEVYKKNYSLGGGTIFADVLFDVYLDGYITAYCSAINMVGTGCNRRLEFRSVAPKIMELEARVNDSAKEYDLLGTYNEYGVVLKDFQYIPQLVAAIKSRARLHRWYDFRVWDSSGDINTPRYEIYKFSIDLPALGAHVGYGAGGEYTLTEEQKQIKATENKIYSKLKETFIWNLVNIIPEMSWLKDSVFIASPEIGTIDREFVGVADTGGLKTPVVGDPDYKIPEYGIPDYRLPDYGGIRVPGTEGTGTPDDSGTEESGTSEGTGTEGDSAWSDEDWPDEEGSDDLGEWVFDDWINDDGTVDDSAVEEDVVEVLNKYLAAANGLAGAGVINDNSDHPDGYNFASTIFRNEAAKVAVNLDPSISMKANCSRSFADVSLTTPNNWTCGYAEALLDAGKVSANAKFNPLSQLTKAEATKMMLEAAGCKNVYTNPEFWQAEVAAYASGNGLISSFTDYKTPATRAFVFAIADAARLFCVK